jgi:hypothetical protein
MRKQLHACNAHRGIIVIDKFGFTLNTFRLSVNTDGCVTGAENTQVDSVLRYPANVHRRDSPQSLHRTLRFVRALGRRGVMLRKSCRFFEIIDLRGWSKYCANTLREAVDTWRWLFFNNGWMSGQSSHRYRRSTRELRRFMN